MTNFEREPVDMQSINDTEPPEGMIFDPDVEVSATASVASVSYDPNFVVPEPVDREHAWDILHQTPALPYRHWSWPWSRENIMHEDAAQLARVTGSIGLAISYAIQEDVDRVVEI